MDAVDAKKPRNPRLAENSQTHPKRKSSTSRDQGPGRENQEKTKKAKQLHDQSKDKKESHMMLQKATTHTGSQSSRYGKR